MKLTEIIDIEILQKIQDGFSDAFELPAIIYDVNGKPITKPCRFTEFCKFVRSTPKGNENCEKFDTLLMTEVKNNKTPTVRKGCALKNIITVTVPIIINEHHYANFGIGQAIEDDFDFEEIKKYAVEINVDEDELLKVAKTLIPVNESLLSKSVKFLNVVAEQISILGYQNLQKKELLQKQIEAQKQIKKLSTVVEQSANTIVITDIKGNIEYVNPKFTNLTGYTADEVIGKNPKILNSGTQPKEYFKEMWQTITAGKIWKGEFCNKTKNGNLYWEHVVITPIIDEENVIINFLGVKEDITERKKAEQELLIERDNMKNIFEAMEDGIYVVNQQFDIQYVNPSLTKDFGNYKGKKCYEYFHNKNKICEWCKINEVIKGKTVRWEWYSEKTKKTYDLIDTPLINSDGSISKLEIFRDVTDNKKAKQALIENERKLNESNKTKDKFFSIIAHDLKSPFNSLLGFSEILKDEYDDCSEEEKKKYIKIIYNGLVNTHKLLDDLLTWSRTQKGTITYNPEKINLFLITREINELLKQSIETKSINLINKINLNTYVVADKDMLAIIIRNLISNAIKFTHKHGEITISAKLIQDENNTQFVKICVSDTGVGISKEAQSILFDISENSSTKGTENETGTGLGLILCKEFTEKHGGKIWIESEVGKGSSFFFTIPHIL